MTVENCILTDSHCHDQYGQTSAFRQDCLDLACRTLGASRIGQWYQKMATEHFPSLPKGILLERNDDPLSRVLKYLKTGAHLNDIHLKDGWTDEIAVAYAITAWRGHKKLNKQPIEDIPLGGISHSNLIRLIEEGRWYTYLKGVCT